VQSSNVGAGPAAREGSGRFLETLYALTVFLSAFLLFQIQPIVAKMILPWFGGSSAVWSTCMLFFQSMLLGGYIYAHWLQGLAAGRRQALTHIGLLAVSLLALPVMANPSWKPSPEDNPSIRILGLLVVTVGMPYFLVSTTSSLLQSWYARTHSGVVPYRLFALSNFASMLALISYPLLVEPSVPTRLQGRIWSFAYVAFAVLCGATAWIGARGQQPVEPGVKAIPGFEDNPSLRERLLWFGFSACASTLLLAVTTYLTQDVAAVPFLWIAPLVLYLITFIVCFEAPRLYNRRVFIPLTALALGAMAYKLGEPFGAARIRTTICLFSASLLVCCMFCHGELVSRKPHPRHLTTFYVMISLGGAAGGLFVGLLAPNFFNSDYEFRIGLALCSILLATALPANGSIWRRQVLALLLAGYFILLGKGVRDSLAGYRVIVRNFYGQLKVDDQERDSEETAFRRLSHGVINHGEQILSDDRRRDPITYFCPQSGIGRAMSARPAAVPRRIGVLGLGCGTLAAYGRAGDTYRIYEINPLVLQLADREFTYLRDTPAKVEVVLGDGRLSLEREPPQQFDVLVMDAFSGDSVPVHLITEEAFEIYFRHLKPGGLLAVNVTNAYLNLAPVMERAASHFGKIAILYSDFAEGDLVCFPSDWVLIADPSIHLTAPRLIEAGEVLLPKPNFRMWTDDFSNMWKILK
jgi:hypothetical protein